MEGTGRGANEHNEGQAVYTTYMRVSYTAMPRYHNVHSKPTLKVHNAVPDTQSAIEYCTRCSNKTTTLSFGNNLVKFQPICNLLQHCKKNFFYDYMQYFPPHHT